MSFSSGGGTLTLPSPTNLHGDSGASVRTLRRSLSRSPSRFHLMRAESHTSQNSDSSSGSFQIPSPCPQHHRTITSTPTHTPPRASLTASFSNSSITRTGDLAIATPLPALPATAPPAANTHSGFFSTPLRSGVKLSLRSARPKTTSSKPISRLRASPKSPLKRALSVNSDMGNSAPSPASTTPSGPPTVQSEPLLGQENTSSISKFSSLLQAIGSSPRRAQEKSSRHSVHLDLSGDARTEALASTISSPLKRSDAIMNLDQANMGSPVAKRRSLHGISNLGSDFNVFDFASPKVTSTPRSSFDILDDASRDQKTPPASTTPTPATVPSPPLNPVDLAPPSPASAITKRTSSLRKSTLQQRHDPRSSWGRRQGEKYLAQQLAQQQQLNQQASSSPHAQQHAKKPSSEWLFSASPVRSRPRASLDQLLRPEARESPFSRGSLPNASMHPAERTGSLGGAPTHQPHPLSRTLTTSSSGSSLPDDSPTHFPVQLPPDRPRATSIFARSLPLNAHRPRSDPVATPQYKSARPLQSVFASAGLVSKMSRNSEDEPLQSKGGSSMIMPDTPCKKQVYPSNTYPPSSGSGRKQHQRRFFFSGMPETPFSSSAPPRGGSTNNAGESVVNFFKLRSSHARKGSILSLDGDISDSQGGVDAFDLPPTPTKSVLAKNVFGNKSRSNSSPVSIRNASIGPPSFTPEAAAPRDLITSFSSPAGSTTSEKASPRTPRESSILHNIDITNNMAPPDASRLSISNDDANGAKNTVLPLPTYKQTSTIFPPATPTTDREAFVNFIDRRVSITPVHGAAPADTDAVLSNMFGKVECVGKGEFSQVYRVNTRSASAYGSGPLSYLNATPSKRASSRTPSFSPASTSKVYAVKKVRLPYFGQKEREAKLREVAVLEAVRDRENVLQIFDHWEQNGHLYIQTEYCDEGGLDKFLKKAGEHGRLDDFRIWKILLEAAQGLRYVHDAGFIHLDLKPANIFVTYEGHLKIGDFGMAASWPAPKGIEGEGDREYMGPEILQGKYDKPADIFALGLIVLEIACNVFLPDNGPIWVALREGDMSVVPSLTAGEANALVRDSSGMPVVTDLDIASQDGHNSFTSGLDLASTTPGHHTPIDFTKSIHAARTLFGSPARKPIGLQHPPEFMVGQNSYGSLDSVVASMISPDPTTRPTVHELLETSSLQWIHARRRAPATIFEGNWGPEDDDADISFAEIDTEMTDV